MSSEIVQLNWNNVRRRLLNHVLSWEGDGARQTSSYRLRPKSNQEQDTCEPCLFCDLVVVFQEEARIGYQGKLIRKYG